MLATLLSVVPKARRQGLRLLVTPDTILRWHRSIIRRTSRPARLRGQIGVPRHACENHTSRGTLTLSRGIT